MVMPDRRCDGAARFTSAWARIADAIGRKADVAWEFAATAEIYAACAAFSRSSQKETFSAAPVCLPDRPRRLFDHLGGPQQDRWRKHDTERLGGFEV